MKRFELIAFDIDGTLTESKQSLKSDMAELLYKLLSKYKVAAISGAGWPQFEKQFLSHLSDESEKLKNLYLLPTNGALFCTYSDEWKCLADKPFTEEEKDLVKDAIKRAWKESGLEEPQKIYGEQIEDRGTQISFSALGQEAPIELKKVWDPYHKKRDKILIPLKVYLRDFYAHLGGTTTIDITRAGVDKAYGLEKLMNHLGVSSESALFVGDALYEGGNDSPALKTGMECRAVTGPEDTKLIILELLDEF
jgi:phosphomannomutase